MHLRLGLTCVVLCIAVTSSRAATPAEIHDAIDKGKAYLYGEQKPDRTWEYDFDGHGMQKTGQTALAVYALLCAGESPQDERLAPAIAYLRKNPTTGVYALGLRCQIWLMLPPTPENKAAMLRDANVLVRAVKRGSAAGDGAGMYDYNGGGRGWVYSHSRSQYGVLGVWAAEQSGVSVPKEYWQLVEKAWIDHQDESGGWNYIWRNDRYPVTAGMTAVGVATLFITQDYLHASEGLNCGGNLRNPSIDRGMKWLSDNFQRVAPEYQNEENNPEGDRSLPYSTLYAIERVGVASGYKYFNGVEWYQKGASWLVRRQKEDGEFPGEFEGIRNYTTGLALLFLVRGSSPLMMNKLDYSTARAGAASAEKAERPRAASTDTDPHWNQRPRDVANAARWTGRQIERELNWQIVSFDSRPEDFHDAPILYIAGNQKLQLNDEQDAKLKAFVEQGGLIVGNADCGSASFIEGFKSLGSRLFAYEFAPLPENHVIYTNQQFPRAKWKNKPSVQSLGNGAREFMILLSEGDPARNWQMQQWTGPREEQFQLAADIFLYAVDKKNLRRRGESFLVVRNDGAAGSAPLKLARLVYSGNWNPEPGGWRRLANVMHNDGAFELSAEPVKLGPGSLAPFKVAHMTGTMAFHLNDAERAELKKFLTQGGGTLIVDAAGGSTAFNVAAEAELAAIVPEAKAQLAQVLEPRHPFVSDADGKPIDVDYRDYARTKLGMLKGPQLRGVTINNRVAIVYSREDLSVGLVGQPVDGIVGYTPATATRLMGNVLRVVSGATATTMPAK